MALGSVVSNRCFGSSLTLRGQSVQRDSAIASHSTRHYFVHRMGSVQDRTCMSKFTVTRKYAFHVVLHANHRGHLVGPEKRARKVRTDFLVEPGSCHRLQNSIRERTSRIVERNSSVRRFSRQYMCFLSSGPPSSSWIHPKKIRKPGISFDGHYQQLDFHLIAKTFFDFKSEQYDTGPKLDPLKTPDILNESTLLDEDLGKTSYWWEQFPKRWLIVLLCFAAFLLCNMDRVNMSIAILPMASEFKWSPATVGLIQSSFFWGYILTQILGGIWADKIGGKIVLGFGVVWWSLATMLTPVAARLGLPYLLIMRAFMGIGEGVAMPAMNNMLSRWIPLSERSRSLALVYSGMYLGSVTGLAVSPILINKFGWPSVFYSFGSLGSIWFAIWAKKAYSSPSEDPELRAHEKKLILGSNVSKEPVSSIPWRLILSKAPVWALIISHFCHNWGTFILLTWMPTYYNQVLKFNLTESGLFCVLPWLTMAIFANVGGWIADTLVSKGLSVTTVRKIMQSIGFLGPAFFLTQLSHVNSPALAVLCMACSQGSDAFSQSGLYSNHQDIGPRYASQVNGLR